RPQYQALLADVRRLRANGMQLAVVVAALDRFGRKLLERVRCREELKALGVPTHSVRDGGEVSDLVANVLASVAEEEVRRLGGRAMCYQSVRRALSSPVYIARFGPHPDRNGLSRPAGRWPALIDDTTWQRVQEGVAKHHHMPRQASGRYLLTGLLRCPQCGAR